LKPQTAFSFGIGGEEKLGREMAESKKTKLLNIHDLYYYFLPFCGAL
jgi:hypothetical protein